MRIENFYNKPCKHKFKKVMKNKWICVKCGFVKWSLKNNKSF